MSHPLSESTIVESVASQVGDRLTRKVIADLQAMKDALLAGEDSGLQSIWDEICVQVQGKQSFYWETYIQTVSALLERLVHNLPSHEREALWLQSEQGLDWSYEEEDDRESNPVIDDDIVTYLLSEHVLPAAGAWTNARIRRYLGDDEY